MNDYIAYCGLDCETCEARLATVKNDNPERQGQGIGKQLLNAVKDYSKDKGGLVLFFIQASMRQRLSFMRRMGLSYQRELYVCIANDLGMRKSRL
ncbi:Acetyltransferase (GNAT) family protein [Selenomonas sp. WCT3]|uniref:GNAT family N-acetyltransferase n=1 Tax=Selenomonas sp. WCT3 TaxID=3158785 RepID=UPI00088A4608|nr:Acetyltransferase (GNAT) family protein [Selenomonas ruminantium]